MVQGKIAVVEPGQRLRHKLKKTIYIVKSIKDQTVVLVSEKGEASMLIRLDSLVRGFEPLHD